MKTQQQVQLMQSFAELNEQHLQQEAQFQIQQL